MHLLALLAGLLVANAAENIKFNYMNEDAQKVIKDYALASGQKFVIASSAKGRLTIINKAPVSLPDAFAQLSSALAQDSLAISEQGDTMVVSGARNIQRDWIGTGSELPALKPERMYTWIVTLKYVSAEEVLKQLRTLSSKDGEVTTFTPRNQLLFTDWTSNLQRIQKILAAVDVAAPGK